MKWFVRNTVFGNLMRVFKSDDPLFPVPGAPPEGVLLNLREEAPLPTSFNSEREANAAVQATVKYGETKFGWRPEMFKILSEEVLAATIISERKQRRGSQKRRRAGKKPDAS
jgi:hypothetical protein